MTVIGIDPGLEGAIATISPAGVVIAPMPVEFDEIDARALCNYLSRKMPALVVVEKLHGMPGFGASNFKFGGSYYAAIYCCQILGLPMERVTPQRWKKAILEGTNKDKKAAIKWARNAYPSVNLKPPNKSTLSHDYAEALALAEYGCRMKGVNRGEA